MDCEVLCVWTALWTDLQDGSDEVLRLVGQWNVGWESVLAVPNVFVCEVLAG